MDSHTIDELANQVELANARLGVVVGLADAYRTASAADIAPMLVVPKAKLAAEKAMQIDDKLSSAHTQLGMLSLWYDWDPVAAERYFQRALELEPENAEAHLFYALDPNHVLAHVFSSAAYSEKDQYAEAIAEAEKAVAITRRTMAHPMGLLAPYGVAILYAGLGNTGETLAWLERGYQARDQKCTCSRSTRSGSSSTATRGPRTSCGGSASDLARSPSARDADLLAAVVYS